MDDHPGYVAVFLTDDHFKFNMPDGTPQEREGKKGDALALPAGKQNPENLAERARHPGRVQGSGGEKVGAARRVRAGRAAIARSHCRG